MELRKFSEKDYRYLKWLYKQSFPASERAPFRFVVRKGLQGRADFQSVYIKGRCCGICYVVPYKDMVYCVYLALDPRVRGRGVGTKVIGLVLRKYKGRRLFLAIEELDEKYDNYSQRVSRLHFYENAGFVRTGQKMQEGKVIYDLMGIGGRISNKEYRRLIKSFAGIVMLFFTMKIIEG